KWGLGFARREYTPTYRGYPFPLGLRKWGLGFARREYTPTYRGFDSFVGFWTHTKYNYNHTSCEFYRHFICGDDSRHNTDFTANGTGVYSTHHFTDRSLHLIDTHSTLQPLFLYVSYQVIHHSLLYLMEAPPPHEFPDMFGHIESDQRKTVARMIYSIDQSIGAVSSGYTIAKCLIIVSWCSSAIIVAVALVRIQYTPTNTTTGKHFNIRTPALIWSPLLTKSGYVSDAIVDVTDLFPTVLEAIDGTDSFADERDIYGTNRRSQWGALSNNDRPMRWELIYNVDPVYNVSAIRWHDWKLMQNSPFALTAYRSAPVAYSANASTKGQWFKTRQTMDRVSCKSYDVLSRMNRAPDYEALSDVVVECGRPTPVATDDANDCPIGQLCLYNLRYDPCKHHNLINETDPEFVQFLWNKLVTFNGTSVPPLSLEQLDPRADPSLHNNRWINWLDTGEQADQVDGSVANKVEL
ncbi:unnamed protein product, partial [Oppiella nova]